MPWLLKRFLSSVFNVNKSIRAKIFILAPIIVMVEFTVVTAIWHKNIHSMIRNNTMSHAVDVVRRSNQNFEQELLEIIRISEIIASDETHVKQNLRNHSEASAEQISSFTDGYNTLMSQKIYGIGVVDFNHHIYKSGIPYIPQNYQEVDWIQDIVNGNGEGIFILRNAQGKIGAVSSDERSYITVGTAVMDEGRPIGLVVIDIRPYVIIRSFGTSVMNGLLSSVVLDDNRNLVFCNNYQISYDDVFGLLDMAEKDRSYNKAIECNIMNAPHFMLAYKSTYTGWTNLTFIKRAAVEKDYQYALWQTVVCVLILFFVTILISALIANGMTKKLKILQKQILSVDLQNISRCGAVSKVQSQDEIGQISDKFVQMMQTLSVQLSEIDQLEKQKRRYEIRALEAQINPHFLYNTLNMIRHLAVIQNVDNINTVTTSLIEMLKYSVGDDQGVVFVRDEVSYIRNYLEIMQYKFLNKIEVVYDIAEDVLDCVMIKMVLQPIVENAVKYGISGKSGEYIIIKAQKRGGNVVFRITDKGPGFTKEKMKDIFAKGTAVPAHHGGTGLRNTNQRIKLVYGEQYGLRIYSMPGVQTTVSVAIPYRKGAENEL